MIRLFILFVIAFVVGLFILKLLSKKQGDDVIEGDVVDEKVNLRPPSLLAVLLLGVVLAGIVLFILPRFGISVMGLLQKAMTLLPFVRGFLPF